jgi:hypothetical protein
MRSTGRITDIEQVVDGEKPQLSGPDGIPISISVITEGGQAELELTKAAAIDLVKKLESYLWARGDR